jgi:hypothetical protein
MKSCSLQQSVDKWFSPSQRDQIRVTRFRRSTSGGQSGVIIRLSGATDIIELRFFRHGDGTWQLFPAAATRPTMNASAWLAS